MLDCIDSRFWIQDLRFKITQKENLRRRTPTKRLLDFVFFILVYPLSPLQIASNML
ncbi:MAG: hypothetical protein AVDCRST_MAG74-824 [uncultured Pyrinomonadaceae bacterium]|uniref:Uncharacterized protein n=1 Tax=uncultured Pyrinomonadaceae bacterium TaxID=2283094 RepID=A0A6J4NFW0_9BACT|nr:MAG: hypothetical protein AVDCRST_MAG74-824 [uncultured Pyrinomonadaceae bacterium]